jgi:DNA-binding transcriptional MerR regulator
MDNDPRYTIDDLVELTGCSRRTIRFYVEKGLLEPPAGRGRGGFYSEDHLARLRAIVAAREEGRSLAAIQAATHEAASREAATERGGGAGEGRAGARRCLRWELAPGIHLEVEEEALAGNEVLIRELRDLAARKS